VPPFIAIWFSVAALTSPPKPMTKVRTDGVRLRSRVAAAAPVPASWQVSAPSVTRTT
jgi:hypothetical protein